MTPHLFLPNRKGAALIALVAAILLFSVLAAAIVPMMSSSGQQSILANLTANAYLLAESGYRYAASQFLHAGASEQDQNQAIENLDGNYTLDNNGGRFNLQAFSYFYELTAPVNGESQFIAHVPGNYPGAGALPDDTGDQVELGSTLKLRIGRETYTLTPGSGPVGGFDDRVAFFVNPPLAPFPAGTPVYPVADVDLGANTTLSEGGNLDYDPGDGRMFPLRNGNILVNGRTLNYRFNDRGNNQFVDVRAATDPILVNFDLTADPEIVLTRYVRLHATGIYGSGGMQTARRVVYYTPLPPNESSARQESFTDRFNNSDNWSDTAGADTNTGLIGGDSALRVDRADGGLEQRGALTIFSPDPGSPNASAINFGTSQRGTRGYLSYDMQIKIGYENSPPPINGFIPDPPLTDYPLPAYVGAGLSFRLGGVSDLFSNNGYGISFLRGNSHPTIDDGIPDELVPFELEDQRAMLLWRIAGNGDQITWLAYKRLIDLLLDEDSEDASASNALNDGSGSTDLWDLEPENSGSSDRGRQRNGSTRNWYYGIGSLHTYNWTVAGIPVRNSGTLTSNSIALPADSPQIFLTFWSWHDTESGRVDTHDLKQIIVLGSPNSTYTINGMALPAPDIITGPDTDGWYQGRIDLSAYAGQTIQVRFNFDTVDALNNDHEGWYIDDVQLSFQWPPQYLREATVALSLKEAMVVHFSEGSAEIRTGDRIYGGTRGTTGTVLMPPLIESGSWGGSTPASGTLLLNRTVVINSNPFGTGEQLYVMGNTGRAEVRSWDNTNDTKANIIQVYLATTAGGGSGGNTNPLDRNTQPYIRGLGQLQWPPVLDAAGNWTNDNGSAWSSSDDYFQLIEWDEINPAASGLFLHPFTTVDQGGVARAILQSYHPDLQTPPYPGIYEATEVGLHAMGDGAENVYFDDFGIRLNVFETDILPTPVQQ